MLIDTLNNPQNKGTDASFWLPFKVAAVKQPKAYSHHAPGRVGCSLCTVKLPFFWGTSDPHFARPSALCV
eukprot:2933462-Pleurochrysis_carterae.AAC.1